MKQRVISGLGMFLVMFCVVACAASEPIYLKSANGKTVRCGPYLDFGYLPVRSKSTEEKVRDCVSYYERYGYERIPGR